VLVEGRENRKERGIKGGIREEEDVVERK